MKPPSLKETLQRLDTIWMNLSFVEKIMFTAFLRWKYGLWWDIYMCLNIYNTTYKNLSFRILCGYADPKYCYYEVTKEAFKLQDEFGIGLRNILGWYRNPKSRYFEEPAATRKAIYEIEPTINS